MNIDPKQIAKMISEDPDEINPLDNTEDKFENMAPYFVINPHTGEFDGEHYDTLEDARRSAEFSFPWMDARIENANGEDAR
jgi:hypothetical protein